MTYGVILACILGACGFFAFPDGRVADRNQKYKNEPLEIKVEAPAPIQQPLFDYRPPKE